jgi:hypothetical protein
MLQVLPRDFCNPGKDCINEFFSGVSAPKNSQSKLDPATGEAMQLTLDVHVLSSVCCIELSPDSLPHTALQLRHAEITNSASQREAHLQISSIEVISVRYQIGTCENVLGDSNPIEMLVH